MCSLCNILNPCSAGNRRLEFDLVVFSRVYMNICQYSAILTSRLADNPYHVYCPPSFSFFLDPNKVMLGYHSYVVHY